MKINTAKAEESQGMVKTLAVMGLSWAAKAGMNYIMQQMTTGASRAAETKPAPSSPVDEPTDVTR